MANVLSVLRCSVMNQTKTLTLGVQLSGNYVNGTGETINLTAVTNPKQINNGSVGYPGNITEYEVINCPLGYEAVLTKGANLTNWNLKFEYTGAGANTVLNELASGAYSAALLAGPVNLRLVGVQLQF